MSFACDNIHGHTLYLEKESIKGKEWIFISWSLQGCSELATLCRRVA